MRIPSERPTDPQGWIKMDDLNHTSSNAKFATETEVEETMTRETDAGHGPSGSGQHGGEAEAHTGGHGGGRGHHRSYSHTHYRVYKRRWFGLMQLVLLNIAVSWDVSISLLLTSERR
jgi:FLVCR family MFS transporter 7